MTGIDDAMVRLSFNVAASPGVYALLLGSGVSSGAGIPTGSQVMRQLILRVAALEKNYPSDPVTWFENKYGKKPTYSTLLDSLSSTSDERKGILRPFFEPTEEEREQKIKIPSAAHRAIAALVRMGIVRIILTTNFDRLLEQALHEEGIEPTVIWHEEMIEGATPYVHNQCTLIKINGDYLDTRLKNTPEELADYPEKLSALLSRIFDEYGLIVSGWSAEDDAGLRKLLFKRKNGSVERLASFLKKRGSRVSPVRRRPI